MREDLPGLIESAFACDGEPFVLAASLRKALDELQECLRRGTGIALLTGPPGVGKSVVCQRLAAELKDELDVVVMSSCGCPTRRSLLQSILFELHSPYAGLSEQEARLEIVKRAQESVLAGRGIVLVVDEAHLLTPRLLEQLRSLTNHFEHGRPLVRLALAGTLQLEEQLILPELELLNQRIACHVALDPLSRQEAAAYLAQCIEEAGASIEDVFTPEAIELICHASDGVLRCLHRLSQQCLLHARGMGESQVTASIVRGAFRDLQHLPLQWNPLPSGGLEHGQNSDSSACVDVECDQGSVNADHAGDSSMVTSLASQEDALPAEFSWKAPVASLEVGAMPESISSFDSEQEPMDSQSRPSSNRHGTDISAETHEPEDARLNREFCEPVQSESSGEFSELAIIDRYAQLDRLAEECDVDASPHSPISFCHDGAKSSSLTGSGTHDDPYVNDPPGRQEELDDEGELPTWRPGPSGSTPDEIIEQVMTALKGLTGDNVDSPLRLRCTSHDDCYGPEDSDSEVDDNESQALYHDETWPITDWHIASPGEKTANLERHVESGRKSRVFGDLDQAPEDYDVIEPPSSENGVSSPDNESPHADSGLPDQVSEGSSSVHPAVTGRSESSHGRGEDSRRPYLRLFSRLRRMRTA